MSNYVISDAFAVLVAQSPLAHKKAAKWRAARSEMVSNAGWSVTARLIRLDPRWSDAELSAMLKEIEAEIHAAPNRTRHAMNSALNNIGVRSSRLEKLALAAAKRIGKVEVDHGDTSCQTHDATTYIKTTVAHQRKLASRRAKR